MLSYRNIIIALLAIQFSTAPASAQPKQAPETAAWPQPDVNRLPPGIWKDAVLYGHKLIVETYNLVGPEIADKAKRYSGNNLACQNCHLDGGRQRFALSFIGVYGAFPAYMARENEVRTLEDRINGCFERSMNGRALPVDGKEMKSLVAYIQFLSTGVPVGTNTVGRGVPPLPLLTRAADPKRGGSLYQNNCASCHQAHGQGVRNGVKGDAKGYQYPPLWGPDSFNDGAGMHRLISSAGFIHANMPFGTNYDAPTLSVEDAWDIAAYLNIQPRPMRPHLDRDYPNRSRKVVDAPFPPFGDQFPLKQHQLGPFQPILDAQKVSGLSPR